MSTGFAIDQQHEFDRLIYRCPRTRSPEKRGEIFIKGQINNAIEKCFYLERYLRKEQFNSTNQSILSHPGARCTIFKNLQVTKYKLQVISY
jgi:hypothetical protein